MRAIICPKFCRYYKAGQAEEPGCGPLARLQANPGLAPVLMALVPDPQAPLFGLDPEDPRLLAACAHCEYRVDGCDFRDGSVPRDQCAPCGGLIALAGLWARGLES